MAHPRARALGLVAIAGLAGALAFGCEGKMALFDSPPERLQNQKETRGGDAGQSSTPDPFPEVECEGIACEDPLPSVSERVVRLTHRQWENTVRDLLYLEERPGASTTFLPDTLNVGTFDRTADSLSVTPSLWDDYREAAEVLARQVSEDPEALQRLLPENAPEELDARIRAFIETFLPRAYRRPVTDEEVEQFVALANQTPELFGAASFERAAELVIRTVLQSPHFLYRVELTDDPEADVVALDGFERASKLSYALWNTMPDEALMQAAERGDLEDHERLTAEVRRMLDDPRARDVLHDFHGQLLGFGHFEEMAKDGERFPNFSENTPEAMQRELELFIEDVIHENDGTYRDLMTATHTFVNAELAAVYGVDAPGGEGFVRVELDPATRRGLLTRSGFLALNATAYDPNPIHRGVFVQHHLLCNTLPLPPDDFSIPDGVEGNTNRERIDNATRECGGACHSVLINPPGFALENYDALGAYRTVDGDYPVDASGELRIDREDKSWQTADEFISILAESPQVHACYVRHWLEYVTARVPNDNDEPLIARLAQASVEIDASVEDLLVAIVTSDVFMKRDTGRGEQ